MNNPLWDSKLGTEEKLNWLIGELTLDEKMHLLASGSGGVERLGIPNCRLGGEAAHGVEARNDQNGLGTPDVTTSFPQPIGMSSSWDKDAIKAAGEVVGREARITYYMHDHVGISRWAPTVDLLRDPRWGRNEEAYGEDPVQVGTMASSYIRGIQGEDKQHLMAAATLKHFYANNTEIGRGWKNVTISPRNKYELYLEPFRRCIEDGGAEGAMTAYNRINGVQGLFNDEVKNILKKEFGLTHAVSDGGAMELCASFSHSTAMDAETVAKSIKAGVDAMSGKPDGVYAAVLEAYELGLLSEEDMDTAIKNVYRTKIRLGIFEDKIPEQDLGQLCDEKAQKVCKNLTDQSLVLLKNDGALPLNKEALSDMVMIGPVGDKWYQDWYGGEAFAHITLKDGLAEQTKKQGQSEIPFVDGCDRIRLKCGDKYLATDPDGKYHLSDTPDTFRLEDWGEGSYTLFNERTGKYMITTLTEEAIIGIAAADGTDASSAKITGRVCDGKERIFSWFDLEIFRVSNRRSDMEGCMGGPESNGKSPVTEISLQDRFGNALFLDPEGFVVSAHGNNIGLTRITFKKEMVRNGMEEALTAASDAKTVLLALGHNPMINAKEEVDRSTIEFIPYQQRLFDEIYKINPNIIVVLMSDYPYAINVIHEKARAILWSATGSQCMGQALADAIVGEIAPAGRLTQTWYQSDKDLPDIDNYDIIGKGRTYQYFEGNVLYPFGYGLTYSDFEYDNLEVTVQKERDRLCEIDCTKVFGQPEDVYTKIRMDHRILNVSLKVTNTGNCTSDEVVQIYARALNGKVKRANKQLIGFERVRKITPGETRKVELTIPIRELAFYDVISETLIVEKGAYEIMAGPSSAVEAVLKGIVVEGETCGVRDLSKKIKADHFDAENGSQIVEGLYGFSALMAECTGVYEPDPKGKFNASYAHCQIPSEAKAIRIHGQSVKHATIKVFVDDVQVGELALNTRDYERIPSNGRNHLLRATFDERQRKESFPLLWADIRIPLDLQKIKGFSFEVEHIIRLEIAGTFKYDWFMMV